MRPRDALTIKAEACKMLDGDAARLFRWVDPTDDRLRENMATALRASEVYVVGGEMLDLAVAASATFPMETLLMDDLPNFSGFLWLGGKALDSHPMVGPTERVTTHAYSWFPVSLGGCPTIAVHAWYDRKATDQGAGESRDGYRQKGEVAAYRLTPSGSFLYPLGQTLTADEGYGPLEATMRLLGTVWRLMQQTITESSHGAGDQRTRGELAAVRVPDSDAGVTVVQLRRRKTLSEEAGESGREYRHQWIVKGHWRKQPYRGEDGGVVIRNIYINPYLKGPEGAPLLVRPKVYALVR